jgi:hypothetical protein
MLEGLRDPHLRLNPVAIPRIELRRRTLNLEVGLCGPNPVGNLEQPSSFVAAE